MKTLLNPGMSFLGVQGTPDRWVVRLNQREIDLLEKVAVLADEARKRVSGGDDDCMDGYSLEWASLAMRARELATAGEFRVESEKG